MPEWKPSWTGPNSLKYEDGQPLRVRFQRPFAYNYSIISTQAGNIICDATRMSDGAYVALKIIRPAVHPHEVDIGTFLSSQNLAADPKNHCVPIYEVLRVPGDDEKIIIVMPLLRQWNSPNFETIGEAVDFFRQLFEVSLG